MLKPTKIETGCPIAAKPPFAPPSSPTAETSTPPPHAPHLPKGRHLILPYDTDEDTAAAGGSQGRGTQLLPPPAPTSNLLPPPFPPGNSPMRPPPSPSRGGAPVPVGSHAKGVSLMEAGNWDQAVKAFGQALDTARGSACTKEAQYLAAVRLLKASPVVQAVCQVHVADTVLLQKKCCHWCWA